MSVIVLDRDGVINQDSDAYIKSADEWQPIDGAIAAIAALKHAGYRLAIATNQSGIGRGYYSLEALAEMHEKMQTLLAEHQVQIDFIAFCPHLPTDNCRCRKPDIGLLEQIETALAEPLDGCYFVGDSLKDLQAAEAKAMQPVLVKTGKGERTAALSALPQNTIIYDDLAAFAEVVCR